MKRHEVHCSISKEYFIPIDYVSLSKQKHTVSHKYSVSKNTALLNVGLDLEIIALASVALLSCRYSNSMEGEMCIGYTKSNYQYLSIIHIDKINTLMDLYEIIKGDVYSQVNGSNIAMNSIGENVINFSILIDLETLIVNFNIPKNIYHIKTIKGFADNLNYFIQKFPEFINYEINEIQIANNIEYKWLVEGINDNLITLEENKLIYDYIDEYSTNNPEKLAVCYGMDKISYLGLSTDSQVLARKLYSQGINPGDYIGVSISPSISVIIVMLAILRIGAIYVPLDQDLPLQRLRDMIAQCNIKACIYDKLQASDKINELDIKMIELNLLKNNISSFSEVPKHEKHISNIAYVNFSSGSTGTPKAIPCPHSGVIRLCLYQDYFRFSDSLIMLQAAPLYFDMSVFEIWTTLICGGTCIINGNEPVIPERLRFLIEHFHINAAYITSPLFHALIDADVASFDGITQLMVGGDVVLPKSVYKLYSHNDQIKIINGYGPTENTTNTCCYPIPREQTFKYNEIPIGRSLNGTQTYVLDKNQLLCPKYVVGELYVSGFGLAAGYIENGKIINSDKFVINNTLNKRLYRTGDLVRYRFDDMLEFKGREDNQVKINGFRIELGELEFFSNQYDKVYQSVATVYNSGDNSKIVVLFLSVEGHDFSKMDFIIHLESSLPKYMQPQEIIIVENLPLKATGKIDRLKLDKIYKNYMLKKNISNSSLESLVANIWEKSLLLVDKITADSDFFVLGGDSLSAIKCINNINKYILDNNKLPSNTIYCYPRFGDLINYIKNEFNVLLGSELSFSINKLIVL